MKDTDYTAMLPADLRAVGYEMLPLREFLDQAYRADSAIAHHRSTYGAWLVAWVPGAAGDTLVTGSTPKEAAGRARWWLREKTQRDQPDEYWLDSSLPPYARPHDWWKREVTTGMSAARFRAMREAMGLSQGQIGAAIGRGVSTIREIETSSEDVPPIYALAMERLAQLRGVAVD